MKCRIRCISNITRTIITIGDISNIIRTTTTRFDTQFLARGKSRESYARSKKSDRLIPRSPREEGRASTSDNFKCRTHARLPYVLRFRYRSVSSLREERAEILLVATSWATSREKSYRISMPRCLPTSAAEWIPGVAATEG